jgi:hypothetical protein
MTDRILSLLVANPVRSVLLGAVFLVAVGRWLGWWVPVVLVAGCAAAAVVDLSRWPTRWRTW